MNGHFWRYYGKISGSTSGTVSVERVAAGGAVIVFLYPLLTVNILEKKLTAIDVKFGSDRKIISN
jgi:hypothetical protein